MDSMFRSTTNLRIKRNNVNLWRPSSLINLSRYNGSINSPVFESTNVNNRPKKSDRSWSTIVTIVLIEAKHLPSVADDGVSHYVYCKFRLGSETFKSKGVPNIQQPQWKERFQLHLYEDYMLDISLWDKGKLKNSMGSCLLDLSSYEKERTHEIWHQLDDGYGAIHLSVTMCEIRTNEVSSNGSLDTLDCSDKHGILKLPSDWNVVGVLHVNVISAKGLTSRPTAYCTLEIDNERVETHRAGPNIEPKWNKCYVFKVYDVTSTLDLKVYDSSLANALLNESIGKVSIPLLRITNDLPRWYGLKDKIKRSSGKGNCPRILLKMSMVWNPVRATMRLFQTKEVKYIKSPPKFDIALIYSNMKFVSDLLSLTYDLNEYYKRLFEWDDKEFSFFVLIVWVVFCYYLRLWTVPLLLLLPYFYHRIFKYRDNTNLVQDYANDDALENKEDKTFTGKIQDVQKMTFVIKNGIEYIVSTIERLYNLISFKVPFLSYVSMLILIIASVGLYFIPFNYLLMVLGIYKFTRKYLNPGRVLNNDLIEFLSRVPDHEILKDWKELGVPEPQQDYHLNTKKITRSISTSI